MENSLSSKPMSDSRRTPNPQSSRKAKLVRNIFDNHYIGNFKTISMPYFNLNNSYFILIRQIAVKWMRK